MATMTRTSLDAPGAPDAIGPYAHAAGPTGERSLFLSGQTPIDPATGTLVEGDVTVQTTRALMNLSAVLTAAGGSFADVVKVNVYLTSMDDFDAVNSVYASVFEAPYPARTTVAVAGLPLGARIEIEATASI
jgi:2-iminobutanoate/2-iminopropanoate deaminase